MPDKANFGVGNHRARAFRRGRGCVVAIPVKDEADRLTACLDALAAQRDSLGSPLVSGAFGVVIFANNCSDASGALVRSLAPALPFPVRLTEASLPPAIAHAGGARRAAMDLAEAWLAESGKRNGAILTTDADSRVSPDWIARNLATIEAGADAVLGRIVLDEEGRLLPAALHRRGALENAYEVLLTELSARLDPRDHNPWPHHATISGATLAVTSEAYRRVGRLPRIPLGEDKAFVAQLVRHDARIRFCPGVEVTTSGRTNGRAPGGVADTLRLRSQEPEAFCDEALEPLLVALRRAKWRGRLRRLQDSGRLGSDRRWAASLGVTALDVRHAVSAQTFGALWSAVEASSPELRRRLLTPAQLPEQILRAERILDRLRRLAPVGGSRLDAEDHPTIGTPDFPPPFDDANDGAASLVSG